MTYEDAIEWLRGLRSSVKSIPIDTDGMTWQVRIAQADAAMTEQAYWVAKAHKEGLLI